MTDFDSQAPHCHFVTVAEVIEQHEGLLSAYMSAHEARNVIITMQVEMSVGGGKPKAHAAALAVSHDYDDAEELMTMAKHCFPKAMPFAFGWVPANKFGTEHFGIFIEQGDLGDLLANGLIDDIIQTVNVEQAVAG